VLEAHNRPGVRQIENLRLLQTYLLKFYPPTHVAVLVTSKTHPLLETIKLRLPLERLAQTLLHGSPIGTLYIPPVRHRDIAEPKLAERMQLDAADSAGAPARRPGRPPVGPKA
jgi:hypothetical protein